MEPPKIYFLGRWFNLVEVRKLEGVYWKQSGLEMSGETHSKV